MLTTLVLATALLASPAQDKWDLKAHLAPKTSATYNVSTTVNLAGQDHAATVKFVIETKDKDGDKPLPATISWKELTMESGDVMDDQSWDVSLDPHGQILDSSYSGGMEVIRKMLTPSLFAYPDAAVGVGDTWTVTVKKDDKDGAAVTEEMKVESMDKVGDNDVMKISEKISQAGNDGLKGTATWWVDKTGTVLKFESDVTNWEVTLLAGQLLDAHMKGEISK